MLTTQELFVASTATVGVQPSAANVTPRLPRQPMRKSPLRPKGRSRRSESKMKPEHCGMEATPVEDRMVWMVCGSVMGCVKGPRANCS